MISLRAAAAVAALAAIASGIIAPASDDTAPANCSSFVRGFSFPESAALPKNHLPSVKTTSACCAACAAVPGCHTWTTHPSNGCWLHGAPQTPPKAVPCGDGDECATGGSPRFPLPPVPPPPPPSPSPPPKPLPATLAKPTAAHLLFHEDNVGAIAHFNMQTFVSQGARHCECSKGPCDWPVTRFDPSLLDTDNWVGAAASWGAKYFVLVADHFSGFSLWPTRQHNYSVASSPWRGGKGNIVADFLASCRKFGVRPAVYYSVHANWHEGVCEFNLTDPAEQAAFEDMAIAQLTELAALFGDDLAELWFDAGVRQSDAFVDRVNKWVKATLPSTATCHSCANLPDANAVSWMGNEETVMPYPVWNANTPACDRVGGSYGFGVADGTRWCPAHCDAVLRRHYWFWNSGGYDSSSNLNKAPDLLSMHMTSVGRGCNMILDMSPTTTGLLEEVDSQTYAAFGAGLKALYGGGAVVCNATGQPGQSTVSCSFGGAGVSRGAIEMRENLVNGQTVANYTVEASGCDGGAFAPMQLRNGPSLTIGNRRLQFFDRGNASSVCSVRVTVSTLQLQSGPAEPSLRYLAVFNWTSSELDPLLAGILKIE